MLSFALSSRHAAALAALLLLAGDVHPHPGPPKRSVVERLSQRDVSARNKMSRYYVPVIHEALRRVGTVTPALRCPVDAEWKSLRWVVHPADIPSLIEFSVRALADFFRRAPHEACSVEFSNTGYIVDEIQDRVFDGAFAGREAWHHGISYALEAAHHGAGPEVINDLNGMHMCLLCRALPAPAPQSLRVPDVRCKVCERCKERYRPAVRPVDLHPSSPRGSESAAASTPSSSTASSCATSCARAESCAAAEVPRAGRLVESELSACAAVACEAAPSVVAADIEEPPVAVAEAEEPSVVEPAVCDTAEAWRARMHRRTDRMLCNCGTDGQPRQVVAGRHNVPCAVSQMSRLRRDVATAADRLKLDSVVLAHYEGRPLPRAEAPARFQNVPAHNADTQRTLDWIVEDATSSSARQPLPPIEDMLSVHVPVLTRCPRVALPYVCGPLRAAFAACRAGAPAGAWKPLFALARLVLAVPESPPTQPKY
jgi:hypothetical protein